MKPGEAREEALRILYEADLRGAAPKLNGLHQKVAAVVSGVLEVIDDLDRAIGEASTSWRVERMPAVDRNVLRIALWELRTREATPIAVIISEGVRLAKKYSTDRSGAFVNGVIARLAAERTRASQ
jgi:N utilization substance protein B